MLDAIYQEGFGVELVPFIAALQSARYTNKSRSEAVQQLSILFRDVPGCSDAGPLVR